MSLLDTASLIVTPNGYKEGKLYSVIPSDGSGDLSVTRATTATRVNSAGLVELVPYNIFTYSSSFSNSAWAKINATVTSGQSGYDGTNNAFLITDNSTNAVHLIGQTPIVSGQHTVSIYAKANSLNWLWLRGVQSSANVRAWFNLSTGTVGLVDTNGTANIESIGNGWYRCELTIANHESGFEFYVGVSNANGVSSYVGSGQSLYIQDAQLNEGTIKPYQKTETRLNIPRLDYSNGTCPSILVEPQRTNLIRYSEDFTNGVWGLYSSGTGVNPIVTANTTTSPNGTNTADTIVLNAGAGTTAADQSQIYQTFSITNGNVYTFSFYAKGSVGGEQLMIRHAAGSSYTKITLTNDWARYEVTETATYTGTGFLELLIRRGLNEPINANCTFYAWGAQVEAGSYATSYIPTTSASVTRNADVISKTGISSLIGQTEGTIFVDLDFTDASISMLLQLFDGVSDVMAIYTGSNSVFFDGSNGSAQWSISGSLPNGHHKLALAYKANDIAVYIDGTLIGTDTSAAVPTTDQLYLNANVYQNYIEKQRFNAVALWKTRLTNAQLATLTTI